ncbi:MAG: glycosyl transferase [Cytophagia bacterium]|nr:glycosyl transferase [Cytophagia bacterium]
MSKIKILYAVQGTGNGHLSRAGALIPALQKRGELDLLISGWDVQVTVEHPVLYRFNGAGFVFGQNGGIDWYQTLRIQRPIRLWRDSRALPLDQYDWVINDFEPVSALAARHQGYSRMVSLSHQASFLSKLTPRPRSKGFNLEEYVAEWMFKHYAPCPASIGLHFEPYDDFIHAPVIRPGIRMLRPSFDSGEALVYLPAYKDRLLVAFLQKVDSSRNWVVFSKRQKTSTRYGRVIIHPASNTLFCKHLEHAEAVLCGAGFETPAEALFLGKKLWVIPMKQQYEQACNAEALRRLGHPTSLGLTSGVIDDLRNWLKSESPAPRAWPDHTEELLNLCIDKACQNMMF